MGNLSSSNVLFHFTGIDHTRGKVKTDAGAFQTLQSILGSSQFEIRMNKRAWTVHDDGVPGRAMDFDIPMSCFSETPLAFLPDHMNQFGEFGLGMKLDWGVEKGAQNVVYCDDDHQNSYGRSLAGVLDYIHHGLAVGEAQPHWYWFRELVGVTEHIDHRGEREWRFLGRTEDKPGAVDYEPKTVDFTPADILVVVCPARLIVQLRAFLDSSPTYLNYPFSILSSEFVRGEVP